MQAKHAEFILTLELEVQETRRLGVGPERIRNRELDPDELRFVAGIRRRLVDQRVRHFDSCDAIADASGMHVDHADRAFRADLTRMEEHESVVDGGAQIMILRRHAPKYVRGTHDLAARAAVR